jgi:hypothetical protein
MTKAERERLWDWLKLTRAISDRTWVWAFFVFLSIGGFSDAYETNP